MSKFIKSILACSVAVCVLPTGSYANFKVTNNTHYYATSDAHNPGSGYQSPCSSFLGDAGIMQPIDNAPNNTFDIPTGAIGFFCSPSCDVTVYMSKNCDARKVAVVNVTPNNGIGKPNNLPNAEGIYINWKSNSEVTIEGGPKATIFDLMFRKLNV